MPESEDSLHLHILAKSWSSSFLCSCKRRGKGRMPPTAQDMSDKPWITPACTRGKLSHPAPWPWIYVPEGKNHTKHQLLPGAAPSWSKESTELKVILFLLTLLVSLVLKYHVQFGKQLFKNLKHPRKAETADNETRRELTWLHLQRRLSSSITISKQLHSMKTPDTTTLSNLAKQKNMLQPGSWSQGNSI